MSLFGWLRLQPRPPTLTAAQQQRLHQLQPPKALGDGPLRQQRWIVLDLETSGLNPKRDQVLSIGAVAIEDAAIYLGRSFERTLQPLSAVRGSTPLTNGRSPEKTADGSTPADTLLDFMEWVDDSPILSFHAPFDRHMLSRALKDSLGYRLQHAFLDLAELAPLLCPNSVGHEAALDDWIAHFNLQIDERHHPGADALGTAELALILLNRARQQQINSPLQLQQRLSHAPRRKPSSSF